MSEKEKRILELKIIREMARNAEAYLIDLNARLASLTSRLEKESKNA